MLAGNATQAALLGLETAPHSLHVPSRSCSAPPLPGRSRACRRVRDPRRTQPWPATKAPRADRGRRLGELGDNRRCDIGAALDHSGPQDAFGSVASMQHDQDMPERVVSTAKEALWCIVFEEPVDLYAPQEEVICQVSENLCYW